MLNKDNARFVAREGYTLLNGPKKQVSRSLRRFVEREAEKGLLIQSLAFDEGFNDEQLASLERYAKELVQHQQNWLPDDTVELIGVIRDDAFGLVSVNYRLKGNPATASLAELRNMATAVAVLAECFLAYADDPNVALWGCPMYTYRGLPCSITSDDKLWCVSGADKMGGGGILEWCYDEQDAQAILQAMQAFPERFSRLSAHSYLSTAVEQVR